MSKKGKAYLSVFMMSALFFMMIDTQYVRPLGDYVFEFFGLNSWTGDQTGLHLSMLFLGVLFIVATQFVRRHAIEGLHMGWKKILIYFMALNGLFLFLTGAVVRNIKGNAEGLLAIGIEKKSSLAYEFDEDHYTQFDADFTLKNYSDSEQDFYLAIDDYDGIGEVELHNLDGSKKIFRLKGNEEKIFSITVENMLVENIEPPDYEWVAGTGTIGRLILSNENGEKIQLEGGNFLGETLKE